MADIKITNLTEQTTPDDADVFVDVDVDDITMSGSGTNKKITWANIKATLLTYLQSVTSSLLRNHDGWQDANETWAIYTEDKADGDIDPATDLVTVSVDIKTGTQLVWTSNAPTGLSTNTIYYAIRVSATTIKFASSLANAQAGTGIDITADGSGTRTLNILNFIKIEGVDATTKYQKGDKFKLTNDSVISYHYVLSVTKPASDTIIEITGETWLVYSSAITLNYYSKIDNPQGFKVGSLHYRFNAYLSGATSYADETDIIFDTEYYDSSNNYNNSNGIFTAPISGIYEFVCNVAVADPIDQQRYGFYFEKNGSFNFQADRWAASGTGILYANASTKVYLNKGENFRMVSDFDATKDLNATYTSFSGNFISI